jgi:hypothetical protein
VGLFARHLGFAGVLAGLAASELVGLLFMGYAMAKTFKGFSLKDVANDFLKLAMASALILMIGTLASHLPLPQFANARVLAIVRLSIASFGCLLAAWPALYLTGAITAGEKQVLIGMLLPRRFRPEPKV